jgi:hypothetical protein
VTIKNAVFWDVTADVRSSPILVTLMMEALGSTETSVLTRVVGSMRTVGDGGRSNRMPSSVTFRP